MQTTAIVCSSRGKKNILENFSPSHALNQRKMKFVKFHGELNRLIRRVFNIR